MSTGKGQENEEKKKRCIYFFSLFLSFPSPPLTGMRYKRENEALSFFSFVAAYNKGTSWQWAKNYLRAMCCGNSTKQTPKIKITGCEWISSVIALCCPQTRCLMFTSELYIRLLVSLCYIVVLESIILLSSSLSSSQEVRNGIHKASLFFQWSIGIEGRWVSFSPFYYFLPLKRPIVGLVICRQYIHRRTRETISQQWRTVLSR